jgi:hypothetical protein
MDKTSVIGQYTKEMTDKEYKELWAQQGPIQIKMVERTGSCRHILGEVFTFQTPYDKPPGLCSALLHVLDLYTWRVSLGFPSWE